MTQALFKLSFTTVDDIERVVYAFAGTFLIVDDFLYLKYLNESVETFSLKRNIDNLPTLMIDQIYN